MKKKKKVGFGSSFSLPTLRMNVGDVRWKKGKGSSSRKLSTWENRPHKIMDRGKSSKKKNPMYRLNVNWKGEEVIRLKTETGILLLTVGGWAYNWDGSDDLGRHHGVLFHQLRQVVEAGRWNQVRARSKSGWRREMKINESLTDRECDEKDLDDGGQPRQKVEEPHNEPNPKSKVNQSMSTTKLMSLRFFADVATSTCSACVRSVRQSVCLSVCSLVTFVLFCCFSSFFMAHAFPQDSLLLSLRGSWCWGPSPRCGSWHISFSCSSWRPPWHGRRRTRSTDPILNPNPLGIPGMTTAVLCSFCSWASWLSVTWTSRPVWCRRLSGTLSRNSNW